MLDKPMLAVLDNNDRLQCLTDDYFDSSLHAFLQGTAAFFTCSVIQKAEIAKYFTVGNKISFVSNGKAYHFDITQMIKNEQTLTIQADSLTLELRNEFASEYKATKAMTFKQYLDVFLFAGDNPLVMGINEVSDKSLQAEWTGDGESILARLFSLANKFDAEIEFETVLNKHWGLDKVRLNVYRAHSDKYQGIGRNRTDVILEYGNNVETIEYEENIDDLKTAIHAYGTDGLTVANVVIDEKDENGNTLFYSPKGDISIRAVQARDRFPSKVGGEGYIAKKWSYETTNANVLAGQALAELKKLCEPNVTVTIKGYEELNIGDTVLVQNTAYVPTLNLSARISEQEIYYDEPSRNSSTFTNVEILQSQVDQSLIDRVNALIEETRPYTVNLITDNGVNFKNSEGSTTLSAVVYNGTKEITPDVTVRWYKNGVWVKTAYSLTVNASDIIDKAVYRAEVMDTNGVIRAKAEVTVFNVDETKIIRQDNPPLADANTIWIDSSNQINELDVAKIYNQLKDDWVRVTPVTPDEVGAFGYESGVALTDQVNNISIDTSQLSKDAEQIRLDMQKAREELDADIVALQEDVDAKNSDMTQLINSNKADTDKALTDANTAIVDANKKIAATDENVTNINTSITNINNELATKVEKEEVDVLKQTVSNQATEIKQNSDSIALKADSETVDALNQTVINQSTLIEQNAEAIALKASTTDVNAVKETVTAHDSKLTQTAKDITSLVTKTDDTNTALSEVKQTADAITTKIGAIEEDADSTSTKLSELEQNVSGFKTTVSNTYETKQNVDAKANKAKNDAISSAKTETASQVKQMSDSITQTVSEKYADKNYVASQINQKAGEITSTVSSTYTTKSDFNTGINNAATDATTKANNALASAKTDATNKSNDAKNQAVSLAKTETTSQVKQLSDSITSTVSSTYATIKAVEKVSDENGENQWLCNKYNNHNVRKVLTEEDIADLTVDETFTVKDADRFSFDGDYFWLHMCTYLYVSESKTFEMKAIQDDGLSISINNSYVYKTSVTTGSFSSPFSIVLNKGWNKVDIYFNELSGSATFSLSSAFLSLSDRMNCFVSLQNETVSEYKMARLKQDLSGFQLGVSATYETKTNVATNLNTAKSYADTQANNAKTSAINTASGDATTKANAAKTDAINTASTDATNKANDAKKNAVSESKTYTDAQLKITADSITSTVSATYTKQSDFNSMKNQYNWTEVTSASNLNDFSVNGNYFMKGALTNSPVTAWAYLRNDYVSATNITQTIWKDNNPDDIYTRQKAGSTWTSWQRTATAADLGNYYTKTQTESQIEQTASQIRATVNTKVTNESYDTANTGGSNANKWTRFLRTTITNQYADVQVSLDMIGQGTGDSQTRNASLYVRHKQQGSLGSATSVTMDLVNSTFLVNTDIKAVVTTNSSSAVIVDYYVYINTSYTGLKITPITKSGGGTIEYISNDVFGSLPSGSQTFTAQYNGSLGNAKDALQKYASLEITTDGISTEVGKKVGKSEVISTINQSAESVTINASKINLQGALTISQFSTSDKDKINNGISTANTANSTANTAKSRADSAYNLANTANGTANTANNQVNSWKKSGTTKIDGGNIYADSLSAISANLGTLNINGDLKGYTNGKQTGLLNKNSLNFYSEDGMNTFNLSADGMKNTNSNWGERYIKFSSEGIQTFAGDNNTGNNRNSGYIAAGSSAYLWLISKESKDKEIGNFQILNKGTSTHFNASGEIALRPKTQVSVYSGIQMNGNYIFGAGNIITSTGGDASGSYKIDDMKVLENKGNRYIEMSFNNQFYGITIYASDARLKKNIQDTDKKALEKILQIPIKQFDWINGGDHREYGFIAQELEKIFPDAVFSVNQNDGTDIKQIAVDGMLPPMVEAIQELSRQNKELQAKVDTLYSFIESIDLNKITK